MSNMLIIAEDSIKYHTTKANTFNLPRPHHRKSARETKYNHEYNVIAET